MSSSIVRGVVAVWRVRWSQGFRLSVYEFLGKKHWPEVKEFLKELEESLNQDPSMISRLKRNPVVMEYRWVRRRKGVVVLLRVRRMRYRGTEYRMYYVVYEDIERIWFVGFEPRTDSTYEKKTLH